MGSRKKPNAPKKSHNRDTAIAELRAKHQQDLENLTLSSQPFKTLKFFIFAIIQYLRRSAIYLLSHRGWFLFLGFVVGIAATLLVTVDGPHGKHVEEAVHYLEFGLWWIALGVASSIGLGSGLHTFVLYLGPHIAFFTVKAVTCGRVDIKRALYDTIQLKRGPSWLGKDCSQFGPPVFPSSDGVRVPLSSILPQVQLEAMLWGLGTALGELPPYFISRAASLSGGKSDAMEEMDVSLKEEDQSGHLHKLKMWLLSHAQYLNFFTILVLASVPNPLFDLAGIMCGQFGIPFWEFFMATMIGKAIIKTHIQTVFIISVCNNQLLHWIENELIWVLSFVRGFDAVLPNVISKLHTMRDKYMATKPHAPTDVIMGKKKWDFSPASIWNAVVWLVLVNFFVKIVNATSQQHLKKQQEKEFAALKKKPLKESSYSVTASR